MTESIYGRALSQAWHLVWHNKLLWIFGLLSVLLGQFGLNNFVGQIFFGGASTPLFFTAPLDFSPASFFHGSNIFWSLWLYALLFFLAALVVVAAVIAEGALVAVAAAWFKRGKVLHTADAWHKGAKYFWPLFGVAVLRKFCLVLLAATVGYLLQHFVAVPAAASFFLTVVIVAAGLFLALWFSVVAIFAVGYIVEGGETFGSAVYKAIHLFNHHALVSLELSLLLLLINILVALALITSAVWVLLPSFLLTMLAGVTGFAPLIIAGAILSSVLFILFVALVGGVFNAFTISAWIYLFMKMHHEGVGSRALHWFARLFGNRS